jgi:hypothetical protein
MGYGSFAKNCSLGMLYGNCQITSNSVKSVASFFPAAHHSIARSRRMKFCCFGYLG